MAAPADLLVLNGAPTQRDRARSAPKPGAVKVDGRSLAELLAFAPDYGALISFYDLNDVPDGDWSAFFLGDPSIGHALASLDLAEIEAVLDRLLAALRDAGSFETRLERLREAIAVILRLIRIHGRGETNQADLERALAGLIGSDRHDPLTAPARRLALHLGGAPLEDRLRHGGDDWFRELLDLIEALVAALLTVLDQERETARAALEASFEDPSHPPQSGLYDAFAKLFRHAQDSINTFPERLIRFYQSEVLRQTSRAGTPDSVYLAFTPAKGFARVELPRFTQFLAGTDADGESIAYALDSALSVDAASIESLRTLTVTSQALGEDAFPIPRQVLTGSVALADTVPRIAEPFPLFGSTSPGIDGVLTTAVASLGFIVASPTLMLTGGTRTVTLGLTLAPGDMAELTKTLESLGAAAGGLAPDDVFTSLMGAAFALRYSTAGGWVDIKRYDVKYPAKDPLSFTLSFTLGPDADPFVALSTGAADTDAAAPAEGETVPGTDMPALAADLLQDPVVLSSPPGSVTAYPYALLSKMMLSALSIDVEVVGLADLQASTPTGPVDTSQPFLVFGSPPVKGATLEIAAPELFAKCLSCFTLAIEWFGLPTIKTGFRGYYQAYVIDADGKTVPPGPRFDNRSFKVRLAVHNPGWWNVREMPNEHYLFRTEQDDPVPCRDSTLAPGSLFRPPIKSRRPPAYYDPKLSAVRLRLSRPETAFGNILYAPNVVAASVRLTAAASACAQRCGHVPPGSFDSELGPVIAAGRTAPDAELDRALKAAAQGAVASLDGAALTAIHEAIAASEAEPGTKAAWRESLSDALGGPTPAGWFRRLFRWLRPGPDFETVHSNLSAWLAAHEAELETPESTLLGKARAALEAASGVLAVQCEAAGQPAAIRRPVAAAGLRDVQAKLADSPYDDADACIRDCMKGTDLLGFPNQPWLPMAASITVDYNAATTLIFEKEAVDQPPASLFHMLPLGGIGQAAWKGGTVPLLYQMDSPGALYIGLSEAATQPTLLFQLTPPPGGWSADRPQACWAQFKGEGEWPELPPLRDGTNDLRNSGIVSLKLADPSAAKPLLRLSVPRNAAAFPMLAGLATNAAMATWVGPGGGAGLGIPLPAGTIAKPASPLPGLGSIDQPMPSSGGSPADIGAGFEKWLAERLRHKDRGIQPSDYSDLLLEAFPSLWQVAVVPASDGGGGPAPGNVWIVPIPGPRTPDVSDPATPSSNATMRTAMADFLASRISPFIQLTVTDPPYLRLQVDADLIFTDADSEKANIERLNAELIEFLSPWPPTTLPPRPDDYYTLKEVAHFIRHRPYVRAIISLRLIPVSPSILSGWHYLTSAASHSLKSIQPAPEPGLLPRLSLIAPGAAEAGGAT
ncbi:MAG TPA: hypothetical protein VE053_00430 [Allosphingosinicella sp.]|nr:hypothetical protein [Allosphingosinicella sp.]